MQLFMRVKTLSVFCLRTFMAEPPVRRREAAAAPRVARAAAAAGAAPGRHEQEGDEAPGGVAEPLRQAL